MGEAPLLISSVPRGRAFGAPVRNRAPRVISYAAFVRRVVNKQHTPRHVEESPHCAAIEQVLIPSPMSGPPLDVRRDLLTSMPINHIYYKDLGVAPDRHGQSFQSFFGGARRPGRLARAVVAFQIMSLLKLTVALVSRRRFRLLIKGSPTYVRENFGFLIRVGRVTRIVFQFAYAFTARECFDLFDRTFRNFFSSLPLLSFGALRP